MAEVLVLVEKSGDTVRKPTLELLTIARRLGEPAAVCLGGSSGAVRETLGQYGAAKVYDVDVPGLDDQLIAPLVAGLAAAVNAAGPAAVLITASPDGKEAAGRLAARIGAGVITDAIDVQPGDSGPVATQSVFAASWVTRSRVSRGIPVITVKPNAAIPETAPTTPSVESLSVTDDTTPAARVTNRAVRESTGRAALTEAAIVVAGGRGVGSPEGFAPLERLADALGAAVGATRAATDLGWYPHEFQIGQTGKTVSPQLYLGAGVSGAIQHRAGMQTSKTIIAVNKDPKAPIFDHADFGVVGDLHSVVPQLADEVEKRKG